MFNDLSLGFEGVELNEDGNVGDHIKQLGYMGVATNHILTGIMADFDQSRIKLLELAAVMATTPKVIKAAKFPKKLLKEQQLGLLNNSPKSQW